MTEQLDTQGEAREALSSMVTDYSKRVLSDPRMLRSLVTDLLPDLPRERNLLVTAAESDVAGDLTRHVEEHHLDPDTAVQLVSRSLTEHTALDPAASTWVTTEYAQALGYRVRSDAPLPVSQPPPPTPPPAQETVTSYGQYGSPQQFTSPPQDPAPAYPGSYPAYGPPQSPPLGQPPVGPPQQGPPPWQPPLPPPKKRNRWPIFAAAGTAAVLVIGVVAAVAGGAFNSPKPTPSTSPTPAVSHTPSHSPTPTPAPSPLPSVASLAALLPADIDDPATQCSPAHPKFTPVGLVQSYNCNDPGLPNGTLDAYQMNSFANYQKTWAAFNKWWGFTGYTPGSNCPPPGSDHASAEGTTTWSNDFFPTRQGQVLECEWTGSSNTNLNDPSYAWSEPTENTFFVAWGGDNTSFAAMDTWWGHNSQPLASPTAAAPSPTAAAPSL